MTEKRKKSSREWWQFVESEVFYSHKQGYKLKLGCYPDGGSLAFYFMIVKGEFDNFLEWPCRRKFKLSLVNHETSEDERVKQFHFDTTENSWKPGYDKPTKSQNLGVGEWNFIPWTVLTKSPHLLKNDSISIKCSSSL